MKKLFFIPLLGLSGFLNAADPRLKSEFAQSMIVYKKKTYETLDGCRSDIKHGGSEIKNNAIGKLKTFGKRGIAVLAECRCNSTWSLRPLYATLWRIRKITKIYWCAFRAITPIL